MTTIYVDGAAATEPGAPDRLAHLADAGHELVLVAGPGHAAGRLRSWASHLTALPDGPHRDSWYVTADPATCAEHRAGLRTVLVGPRADGPRASLRCDSTARDGGAAVLEILAADAMR
jgi:hypothetical protein